MTGDVSTGLSRYVAATLAYSGWWVTGVIFLVVEQRDPYVRFHAAQASVVFGAIAAVVTTFAGLAAMALMFMPRAFAFWVWMAGAIWGGALVLWALSMWHAATGRTWRIPVAARLADRLCGK